MSAFGFDPEQFFRRRTGRPRVVGQPGRNRRRFTAGAIIVLLIVLLLLARWLLGLRSDYLFYSTLGHANVFWTPFVAHIVLFLIGLAITAVLVGINVIGWAAAAAQLDRRGRKVVAWVGAGIAVVVGIIGGAVASGQWQTVLLWMHGSSFGATDPVFHTDYSFFLFSLPVIDLLMGLLWAGVIIGLLGALALAFVSVAIENSPEEVPLPLSPPPGKTPRDALRVAVLHAGILLAAIFVLAIFGAHFGVYHLATSSHDTFVGLDATQRNVVRPVLGGLQVVALIFAVITLVLLVSRWRTASVSTIAGFGALLAVWLVGAGLAQGIPAAIYQGTSVNPNAQVAQTPAINDYLNTSRYAWALRDTGGRPDVVNRAFGSPHAPTLQDIQADPATLRNVRIQDFRQLPDTLAQVDRSRSYQTYPTITVDRYADPSTGGDTEVMLGPREIAEGDVPNASFVNSALNYTHGYGVTAVSINQWAADGKPQVLVGQQPMKQVVGSAPPDLYFNGNASADPRIYCGLSTTQPVVSGTQQREFDYPSTTGDQTSSAGADEQGIPLSSPVDKLAISLSAFNGFDLFLNNSLTSSSRALLHRNIADRIQTLAPFLAVDGDPYVVVDPETGHLMWIADAYVKTGLFPESYQLGDGTSYMRNAVKVVIDAKTCATTLYALDLNEPITAAWNAIYPGLLTPFDQMSTYLRGHLRYPQDLFTAQAQVYAVVHVQDASVFFNGSDRYRVSQEMINNQQQDTQPYYIEATLPGGEKPQFVLFQTFSPGTSGSGSSANNMTAWLAAQCDYTTSNHPQLVAVRLNNGDNVLGPLQFDNNITANRDVSQQITLLGQQRSTVILGNVIVLPFNNDSFLYIRPFYVLAAGSTGASFPLLQYVIVGTQQQVADDTSLGGAMQKLLNTTQPIPGLTGGPSPSPTPTPAPGATPTPTPAVSGTLQQQILALGAQLEQDNAAAQTALMAGDYATYGKDEAKVQQDLTQLKQLLNQAGATPSPSP
jgi:uncharacterized membrane protein (UPF0182 family)